MNGNVRAIADVGARVVSALVCALLLATCGREAPFATLDSAKGFLAKRDFASAAIQIKNVLQRNPEDGEARYLLGKLLFDTGQFPVAMVELQKARDLKYALDEVIPILFKTYAALGQPKKTIAEAGNLGLISSKSRAEVQAMVGMAHLELGDRVAADKSITAALEAQPGNSLVLMARARLQQVEGRLTDAVATLQPVTTGASASGEAMKYQADLLVSMGRRDDAISLYRKAIALQGDLVNAHIGLAWALLERASFDPNSPAFADVTKQLEALRKVALGHVRTQVFEAQLLFLKRDFKAAQEKVLLLLRVAPESAALLEMAGAIELNLNSLTQAEAYLAKALSIAPDAISIRRWLALAQLESGQPIKALKTLEPIMGRIDKSADLLNLAGEIYLQIGNVDRAEQALAKAAKLNPEDIKRRTALAIVRLDTKQAENAFVELQSIASQDKGTAADLALIARYMSRNQPDSALKAIEALEKKRPESPQVFDLRGRVQLQKKDVAAARASFERALRISPTYVAAVLRLAEIDVAENKIDAAAKRFENLLATDPKNVAILLVLAELKVKFKSQPDEVLSLLNRAIAASPADPVPRGALINYYLSLKAADRAVAAGQEALAAIPDRAEILEPLARAQQVAGDWNQALATYSKLASLQPNSVVPHVGMADVLLGNKDREGAARSLRKALAIKPDLLSAQRGLIMLELVSGRVQEATLIAREVQQQRPLEAVGYLLEGDIRAARKSWNEAVDAYRLGLKRVASVDLAMKLHQALIAGGNPQDAAGFAVTWLRAQPKDNAIFRLYLAEHFSAQGDFQDAALHYRALLAERPDSPEILNNLAYVTAQLKEGQALEYAEKANKLAPNQPAFMDTLGVILTETGQVGRAIEVLEKAVQVAPQENRVRLSLARALIKAGKPAEAKKQLAEIAKAGDKFVGQAEVARLMQSL